MGPGHVLAVASLPPASGWPSAPLDSARSVGTGPVGISASARPPGEGAGGARVLEAGERMDALNRSLRGRKKKRKNKRKNKKKVSLSWSKGLDETHPNIM